VLADRLREIRKDHADLTGPALAQLCGWSKSKVSRIENARTSPSEQDIRDWCRACHADDQATDLVASLRSVEGMFIEWRRMEHGGLKQHQESVRPLFERTRRFRSYSSWIVPGLLQTRAYTTAVLRATQKRRVAVDDVAAAVSVRMARQAILHTGNHRFAFVVEESVLRNCIGGREVAVGQLDHLLTVGSLPSVSLGIIPMNPNRERYATEDFWIFDNAQVAVELVSGYLTITQPREIEIYAATFAQHVTSAVHGTAARALITEAIRTLG
jgi:transcriptional regulator with XRE-family HTH domain